MIKYFVMSNFVFLTSVCLIIANVTAAKCLLLIQCHIKQFFCIKFWHVHACIIFVLTYSFLAIFPVPISFLLLLWNEFHTSREFLFSNVWISDCYDIEFFVWSLWLIHYKFHIPVMFYAIYSLYLFHNKFHWYREI